MDIIRNPIDFIGFALPMDNLGLTSAASVELSFRAFISLVFNAKSSRIAVISAVSNLFELSTDFAGVSWTLLKVPMNIRLGPGFA